MKGISRSIACVIMAMTMMTTTCFARGYAHVETQEYAAAKSENQALIKSVFDKFRYQMTVEWDQNDSTFKSYAQSEFEKSVLELEQRGVSASEIQEYVSNNILDAKTRKDYSKLVSVLKKQGKSEEEVAQAATSFMNKSYQQGASYSAGAAVNWKAVAVIIAVVVVAVVTVIVVVKCKKEESKDPDCPEEEPKDPDCPKEPDCPPKEKPDCPPKKKPDCPPKKKDCPPKNQNSGHRR